MPRVLQIESIEAENLRGYGYTRMELRKLVVLVGENNEGKSSLLKMLDRMLKIPDEFWSGNRVLSSEDYNFWFPANNQQHRARRFTLNLTLLDGNFARRFKRSKGDSLALRFAVKATDGACRLNIGPPRRAEAHDDRAVTLLRSVISTTTVLFLPPIRDAQSSAFAEKVTSSVRKRVQEKLSHSKQAGSPKEYRLAKEVVERVRQIVESNKEKLTGATHSPLTGMMRSNEVRIDLAPSDVSKLIDGRLYLYVSTGEHDGNMVLPGETGNGLQSLIDIDLSLAALPPRSQNHEVILIVEEPEAFLHPSAQRQFMRFLRHALDDKIGRAVLTTHSATIVDESRYEEVVVVRRQRHFAPQATDQNRLEINTSLMSAANSEVFFARTVVFVEGEADKALLNTLLKRVAAKNDVDQDVASVVFQATGSSSFFSPWLRLVDSYGAPPDGPFKSFWVMDADACSGDRPLLKGLLDSGRPVTNEQRTAIHDFGELAWDAANRGVKAASQVNGALRALGGGLFACDLEWAIFNGSSVACVSAVRTALRRCSVNAEGSDIELARRLGSKVGTGKASSGAKKSPYIRAAIAEKLPLGDLPPEVRSLLLRILSVATGERSKAERLLRNAANP